MPDPIVLLRTVSCSITLRRISPRSAHASEAMLANPDFSRWIEDGSVQETAKLIAQALDQHCMV